MFRRELAYFFGALRFFTRLPVPAWVGHSSEALDRSTRYFPAVGLLVGAIAALVFVLTSFVLPMTLAVLAAMASSLYLTGAFHEDGWSDMVDGFGGGWEKAQILAIMKDSRIGSFGAIALVMLLLARFCALIEFEWQEIPLALLAGHTLSRFAATTLLRGLDYVRDEGKAKPLATRIGWGELGIAGLTALLPLLLLPPLEALLGGVFAALATLWLARLFRRQIGGYTGDCLGATQQCSELAFYCGLLCSFS
ncbi:MAG: adenosylcobinamide-GDP ribazoletransferase [Candidatus Accumulibacter phosphatis]|uniref:Adenosylcobinamide-GDP ribazoletransferase n=4 Tax=Candidatus Accumulibacter TaxID=327159 RepID=A0A7D5SAL0_9PROT|nr:MULTISPECIES: adenosylcobinamide-GDP ribazoletransferase [Candidatus Accumulibacter]QLH50420.1 MAG: adenosylcobinamide-GDP ribazoletransferase [Candidatus Accumulibacter cognatus]MBN8517845.1 adenosylcobinamide-GDP ribazoletransferase [Accumulibacter sp.]MBO3711176.1 adenosylcobinamide-GDP ribazoletransferase [Accumulibacter sp.]MCC2868826.1 adenosylcobinamide-GDP ribazoletransferase [Candidatus Accumulibacter phosphatis]MCM8578893.1 adenosylcobinamide-GDP ribazoletransferase [Accumulibacte